MIPTTVERVAVNTADEINERIRWETEERVAHYSTATRTAIARRLRELDEEWDVERMLEANASTVSLVGLTLGTFMDRRYFVLPAVVAAFLLQHALQGWCPPLPLLRRLGFRTQSEIERERYALKAIRGDFERISPDEGKSPRAAACEAMAAVRR